VVERVRAVGSFLKGVLGADRYEHYLEHHRAHGCGEPMSRREFWRDYHRWQDENPQGRCC
jgi:uncharacterized short protein YbdD (DUF466 family)